MVEIAISLAIIGLALVAILGVLPLGLNVQRDNREETLVDQDASVFIANISQGVRGQDDLTNYVYAIVNTGTNSLVGYTNSLAGPMGFSTAWYPSVKSWSLFLTNGANIIGLLSTPEYTYNGFPNNGIPVPSPVYGISNHIVAYVRSQSGPASGQPPQDNPIVLGDTFGYKIICNTAPVAVDTNLFDRYPLWSGVTYAAGDRVAYYLNGQLTFWQATNAPGPTDFPGQSPLWVGTPVYGLELTANLRELRLTFLWPLLPDGNTGYGRHTFATTVAGQIVQTNAGVNDPWLYFFQPQSFTSAP